jgi:hypothetical protein
MILEIIREDDTLSSDIKEVLYKWHSDFAQNLSGIRENPEVVFDDIFSVEIEALEGQFDNLTKFLIVT